QGTVSVQKLAADGQQGEIAVLRRGRAVGEMAVLDGERRSASCFAAAVCQLLSVGRDSVDKMLDGAPVVAGVRIRGL
ncbi:cyclic nucleotide-binding domain-containing protein, partial [Pseudomonas syringae group genomosp. 7]|uniref:cyclic nucleotide-binding domain-containing protein n=1 Tax=Pseudomonas syringae group genomosp. 7 TaxID=251699 RepID=UPI00376FF9C7